MARCFGCLLVLALLCPKGSFSGFGFRTMSRDMNIRFEDSLSPFKAEQWVNGSTWTSFSYKDLDKEMNGTAPRPYSGGDRMAMLDIKGVSAGSFMELRLNKAVTNLTIIFDYYIRSALANAAGIRIEYQEGYSAFKNIATLFAPKPNDDTFRNRTVNISLEPSCIKIRVYGNGDGGKKRDIVAIDNFRLIPHSSFREERKGKPATEYGDVFDEVPNCDGSFFDTRR